MKKFEINFRVLIILIILQKSEYLISLYIGFGIFSWLPFSPFILIMLFTVVALIGIIKKPIYSKKLMDPFLLMVLAWVAFQVFRGFAFNPTEIVFQEISTGILVFYAYILGRNGLVDFGKPFYLRVFILSASLVFLGLFHFRQHLVGELTVLSPTSTLAYEIGPILDFWPLVFLTRYSRRKNIGAIAPWLIYLMFQLFFLKRAPSVRAVMYIITAEFFMLLMSKNFFIKIRNASLVILIFVSFIAFMPAGLKNRFGNGDTSRQEETRDMLSQLSNGEILFGRGLGGWFELNDGGGIIKLHNGLYGKYIVHIGIAYPILKGGVLLLMLIFCHYLYTLFFSIKRFWALTTDEIAALVFILVYGLFRLIEGPFSPGALFDGICFGYSMGILNGKS